MTIAYRINNGKVYYDKFKNIVKLENYNEISYIKCRDNYSINLPSDSPHNLQDLCCGNNKLIELPDLPQNLQLLYCSYNSLTYLPDLPENSLQQLYCIFNNLIILPYLPSSNLQQLYCCYNKIKFIQPHNIEIYYNIWKSGDNNLNFDCEFPSYEICFIQYGFEIH